MYGVMERFTDFSKEINKYNLHFLHKPIYLFLTLLYNIKDRLLLEIKHDRPQELRGDREQA